MQIQHGWSSQDRELKLQDYNIMDILGCVILYFKSHMMEIPLSLQLDDKRYTTFIGSYEGKKREEGTKIPGVIDG